MENLSKTATALIVDDMATNIQILSDLLKDEYIIKVAKSGKKAIEIAQGLEKPDIILLDIMMDNIDGYEVCKVLKNDALTKGIPIIFITAKTDERDQEYGLSLGAVDYITKPFNPTIVKIKVRNHVSLKLKSDMLEELSMYDGLTHIPNRRYFDEVYDKKYKVAQREKKRLSIMMIDVDFFKPYNDHYGHGRGDQCLIKIATSLQANLKRPTDIVARYGGEEFVVIIEDTTDENVKKIATSLLEAISDLKIPHEYSQASKYVTISIGVHTKNEHTNVSKEELLKIADNALYKAKKNGRNRFEEL